MITSKRSAFAVSACLIGLMAVLSVTPRAQNLPAGFVDELIVGGLTLPTSFAQLPDGRIFISEKSGLVKVFKAGAILPTPFIDLRSQVNDYWDRGLLGIAVDPGFATNGFVYLLHVYENDAADYTGPKTGRLIRVTAAGDVAAPGSLVVLLGTQVGSSCKDFAAGADCLPVDGPGHSAGGIRFASDGNMFVSWGDGSNFNDVDPDALRAQDITSLGGKLLRVTPLGQGVATNPYWNGNASANRSKVWAYGIRNAFRFTLRPGTDRPYLSDVGWLDWEEVDVPLPGANLGWPCYEGPDRQGGYSGFAPCTALYNAEPNNGVQDPIVAYNHMGAGASITGSLFYTGTSFPVQYRNAYFFGDYTLNRLSYVQVDGNDTPVGAVGTVGSISSPVELQLEGASTILYLAIVPGELRRVRYASALPPGGVTYLSDLAWTAATNGFGPVERDRSNGEALPNDGRTLTLNGVSYAKGLGVHAPSEIRFPLAGNCSAFQASAGLDDEVDGAGGNASFEVWADGVKLDESGPMTSATATRVFNVPTAGRNELRLVVVDTGGGITGDHADWADARVTCTSASGDSTPPTVTVVSPTANQSAVALNASITATFSEAMSAPTITTSTVALAAQGSQTPVLATAIYDSTTHTVTLDPTTNLSPGAVYTARILGGPPGVQDAAGNPLAADFVWSFTTATSGTPSVSYLSDLAWTSAQNGWGPVERDRSNGEQLPGDGLTLTLNGVSYSKGLGAHAASDIRFALGGTCTTFEASVGVDDEVTANGSLVFEVWGDGAKLYDSGLMTAATATAPVSVSVSGRAELRLVITDAGDGNVGDHGDWADARITCGGGTAAPPVFGTPVSGPSGVNTHGLTAADLNNDGRLDIVAANAGSNNVSVFISQGGGAFAGGVPYPTGASPKSVIAVDLTGTGWKDLVTSNQDSGTVTVLLNNQNGTFRAGPTYAVSAGAHEAAVGDFNGDGRMDVAVVGWGAPVANVLLGNGDGTLQPVIQYPTGLAPNSIVAGDWNRDGHLDLAITNHDSNDISILFGTGGGAFTAGPRPAAGLGPHSIRAGDLNNDGNLDLVTANDGSNDVSVWLGSPTGTFSAQTRFATGVVPKGVAIADVDGDGRPDVVTANTAGNYPTCCFPGGDTVSLLTGLGTGAFGAPQAFTTGTTPFAVIIVDLTGDGRRDIATANWHSNNVSMLVQQPGSPDTVAPTLADASPLPNATGVATTASVRVTFSEAMEPDTLTPQTFMFAPQGTTTPLPATVVYDGLTRTATLDPVSSLVPGTAYNVLVRGGLAGVKDVAGNPVAGDSLWAFSTSDAGNSPPVATIASPLPSLRYRVGDVIAYSGSATDAQDGAVPATALAWSVDVWHCPGGVCHTHFLQHTAGATGSFVVPDHGDDSYFVLTLTATDTGGLAGASSVTITPQTAQVTLNSVPAGLQLVYGAATVTTPFTFTSIVNSSHTLLAPSPQGGATFVSWSDGGPQQHGVVIGTANVTYTATYSGSAAPAIAAVVPASGATAVNVDTSVTATFSQPMNAATLTPATVQLLPQGSATPLPATVTYDATTRVVTLDPADSLTAGAAYTARVVGGPNGVKDVNGNALAADIAWGFTTGTGSTSTIYVSDLTWASAVNGWGPVEKDRSNGEEGAGDGLTLTLNGVTFAKGLGTHAFSDVRFALGGNCSTFEASVGVDDEMAGGSVVFEVWTDGARVFSTPVMTGASATVPVSVPIGGVTELGLVVGDGGDGIVGDHADWADARVICAEAGDTVPPIVQGVVPAAAAGAAPVNVTVGAYFSESMNPATITAATVTLLAQGTATPIPATVSYDAAARAAMLDPTVNLASSTTYTVRVAGGAGGATDVAGNALAADFVWTFTTAAAGTPFITYLSDLPFVSEVNGWGPVERDRSNGELAAGDGRKLTLNGMTYPKGIGAHSASDIVIALPPSCTTFTAFVGVDDEVGDAGSVGFEVFGDAVKLYDSGLLIGTSPTAAVNLSIAGFTQLRLVVNDGIDGTVADHGDWASARITCSTP